jgi:hypothetical protein
MGTGTDTLVFANGITFSQVSSGLVKSGNDLILRVNNSTTNQVTLKDFFLGGGNLVETITFQSGGQQLTAAQIFSAFGLTNPDVNGSPVYQHVPDDRAFGTILAGQAGAQIVLGSSDADQIDGGAGNDTIRGNRGNDSLLGGDGNDTYQFAAGDGADVINNLSNAPSADNDVLSIEGITRENLWFSRRGDDLVIDVLGGSTDAITIQDWYANAGQMVDSIQAGGSTLLASAVNTLVNAMAAFGAPSGGEITLTQAQRDQVNAIIAANWQGTVNASTGLDSIQYADLVFKKSSNDPILVTDEQLTFADGYRVQEEVNFDGPVTAFEAARAAAPGLSSWALSDSLASFHLSGSDTAAIGGDLAHRDGRDGTLADMSVTAVTGVLSDAGFGSSAQALQSLARLQNTSPRLR